MQRLRERTEELKEKAIDPYASSPEVSPPVSKYGRVHTNTQADIKRTNMANRLSDSRVSLPAQRLS